MKKDIYLPAEKWIFYWDGIYDKYGSVEIHLTGGEPCIYPSFIALVKGLTKRHTVMFTTNLSNYFEEFAKEIDPLKIGSWGIGASFHPAFVSLDSFLRKALLLKNKGFKIYVNFVAYPPQLKQLVYYKKRFEEVGLDFIIIPFRGYYNDLVYPESYTQQEKEMFQTLNNEEEHIKDEKFKHQVEKISPKGELCRAGQDYAVIDSDGIVTRCGEARGREEPIGNIIEGNFKFLDHPSPCSQLDCFCEFIYLVKYEGEESLQKELNNLKNSR